MARQRRRAKPKRSRTRAAKRAPAARPSEAETRLLALAAQITALPAAQSVASALRLLAATYVPGGPLPRAVAKAWLASRGDKTSTLALAWARENVRLALEEALARNPRRVSWPASPEMRAWLVLAAGEAIAHEPPAAAADRLRALFELMGLEPDSA